MNDLNKIQNIIKLRAEYIAKLNLLPYDGSPEIKENKSGKYIYIRKRVLGKLTSKYVDKYSEELYQLLLKNSKEARELKKQIRNCDKELAMLGYSLNELSPQVVKNIEFARINMKINIYNQAILEGVATTFPQTETIIDNGIVSNMKASDVQKILNLKHAWEFVLETNVIQSKTDLNLLSYIAKIVNEGFYENGGMIRSVPVLIGGSNYVPSIPLETDIKDDITGIINQNLNNIDKAIELCLYCMKKQIFNDGNKRAAVIFANHYLISNGNGMLVINEKYVPEFKKLLVSYYENNDNKIKEFIKTKCIIKL